MYYFVPLKYSSMWNHINLVYVMELEKRLSLWWWQRPTWYLFFCLVKGLIFWIGSMGFSPAVCRSSVQHDFCFQESQKVDCMMNQSAIPHSTQLTPHPTQLTPNDLKQQTTFLCVYSQCCQFVSSSLPIGPSPSQNVCSPHINTNTCSLQVMFWLLFVCEGPVPAADCSLSLLNPTQLATGLVACWTATLSLTVWLCLCMTNG